MGAVDATTGAATSFTRTWATVAGLVASPDSFGDRSGRRRRLCRRWVVGVQGKDHNYLCQVDASTGLVTTWNPATTVDQAGGVNSIVVSGGTLYVSGRFTGFGTTARNNIAAIDIATATATSWNPGANALGRVLVLRGGTLYAAGLSRPSAGGPSRTSRRWIPATGAATSWSPTGNGLSASSYTLALGPNTAFVSDNACGSGRLHLPAHAVNRCGP